MTDTKDDESEYHSSGSMHTASKLDRFFGEEEVNQYSENLTKRPSSPSFVKQKLGSSFNSSKRQIQQIMELKNWQDCKNFIEDVDDPKHPLYQSLPKKKIIALKSKNIVGSVAGPNETDNSKVVFGDFISAHSISTYPHYPNEPVQEGSPICDCFEVLLRSNRGILCLADGCNWGIRPQKAARAASSSFVQFMDEATKSIHKVSQMGVPLLRSISVCHGKILQDYEELFEAGTTTLMGGICFELDEKDTQTSPGKASNKWGFAGISIGDCKCFLWKMREKKVVDVTCGNRGIVEDARDPGGRIGPYLDGGMPDLRNLEIFYQEAEAGDILILVSDGVHDNLDPEHIGKSPRDCGLDWDEWKTDQIVEDEQKNVYSCKLLYSIVKKQASKLKEQITPDLITNTLLDYCRQTTESSRVWMQENDNTKSKLPSDFAKFPGKLDHTTCVSFKIGLVYHSTLEKKSSVNLSKSQPNSSTDISINISPVPVVKG